MLIYSFEDIIHLMHSEVVSELKRQNKPYGWFWRLDEFVISYLRAYFSSWVYIAANERNRFNLILSKAKGNTRVLSRETNRTSNEFLQALHQRNFYFQRVFNRLDGSVFKPVDGSVQVFPRLKQDLFPHAIRLKNDRVFAKILDSKVYNAWIIVEKHNCIWEAAVDELRHRRRKLLYSSRHWFDLAIDESQHAYNLLMAHYRLPASVARSESEVNLYDTIGDIVTERTNQLRNMDRAQTSQLNENEDFIYLPNRISSRLKNVHKKQQRYLEIFPDSLDDPQSEKTMPPLVLFASEAEINSELPKALIDALDEVIGERRRRIVVYCYKHERDINEWGIQKEISEALEIPRTTVSDEIRVIKEHATEIKEIFSRFF